MNNFLLSMIAGVLEKRYQDFHSAALAYVPDDPALFGSLTVYEHLVLSARAYEVNGYEAQAGQLTQQFQISDRRNTLAQELSRGARQKAAIFALTHDAKANLFDEPRTGLVSHGIRTMKDSVRQRATAGAALYRSW